MKTTSVIIRKQNALKRQKKEFLPQHKLHAHRYVFNIEYEN
jgi:hypothetical protein